jgi:hypothetical protein
MPEDTSKTTPGLLVDPVQPFPCGDGIKLFVTFNEVTVNTLKLTDESGADRGAVAIGLSASNRNDGAALYMACDEMQGLIGLLTKSLTEARRIDNGLEPTVPLMVAVDARLEAPEGSS